MIIPVIAEQDIAKIRLKVNFVDTWVSLIQIDVADGKLVNGLTYLKVEDFDALDTNANLELHFMVQNPLDYLKKKLKKVIKVVSQVESDKVDEFIKTARKQGYQVGLSIASTTPNERLEPYLDQLDYVQFVSVEPGGSGRAFNPKVLSKITEFKLLHPTIRVQVDGGINENNMQEVIKAGADDVVIGSAIFNMTRPIEQPQNSMRKINKIAFLGGAAWQETDDVYKDVVEIAKTLAEDGYEVVNGGGPGVMRASTNGAHEGGGRVLAITYHPNKPKRHYEGVDVENLFDEEVLTLDYFDRTKVMLQTTDLHILFKGSIGTLSELGMTWINSWIHEPNNKPIILYGDFWREFLDLMHKHFLLVKGEDHMMKVCTTPKEVLDYVRSLG